MLRGLEGVMDKLERVSLTAVLDREVLGKNSLQTGVFTLLRRNLGLYELFE